MTKPKLLLMWLLAIVLIVPVFVTVLVQIFMSPRRALSFLIGQDQALNGVFGGDPDETISSRTGRGVLAGRPWALKLAPVLDWFFGPGHCAESIEARFHE